MSGKVCATCRPPAASCTLPRFTIWAFPFNGCSRLMGVPILSNSEKPCSKQYELNSRTWAMQFGNMSPRWRMTGIQNLAQIFPITRQISLYPRRPRIAGWITHSNPRTDLVSEPGRINVGNKVWKCGTFRFLKFVFENMILKYRRTSNMCFGETLDNMLGFEGHF